MADDNVTIWGSGLKFGRKPANGELLIGDGVGFELANLSAGSGVTISNTAGGIQISATLALNNVILGNGTGAVQTVAPGAVATVNSFDILVFT
jgi:hypothetical protein